jgi:hypothetical protein
MSNLRQALADYLALRRAVGYKLWDQEQLLNRFLTYLEARGQERITVEHALTWATLPGCKQFSQYNRLLQGEWLHVGEAKTDAGTRRIKIRGALKAELVRMHAGQEHANPDGFVFPTSAGRGQSADNLRSRVTGASVERASKNLRAHELPPLPDKITPHSLRRTFASILYAIGEDPGVVMDEMGHTDPALAVRVYRQSMRRGDDEKAALRRLVDG